MKIDHSQIKNILVIKLRAIGDVVLSTVVLSNLRTAFPDARIDFLTEAPSRLILEGNSLIDSVLVFDRKRQHGLKLIRNVRRRKYDLVFDLFGNPRSAIVTFLSGARYRVGFRFKWRQYCYNIVVEPRGGEVHNMEFNLDALRALEIPILDCRVIIPVSKSAEEFAQQYFDRMKFHHKFVVALNPGGGWYTKRWRVPQFAALGDRIASEYNAAILVVWGPQEKNDAEEIKAGMRTNASLIPEVDLQCLAAIMRRCSVLVTNDSGPMHIAAAEGVPVVAIFGPTNPKLQGPFGERSIVVRDEELDCLGCNYTSCPIGNPCMEKLSVETVLAAFTKLVLKYHLARVNPQQL